MAIIRTATMEDVEGILAIYAPFILKTSISFEEEVPEIDTFWNRMQAIMKNNAWLVCHIDGLIVGYAYATLHRERPAYRWTREVSVYVAPDFQRRRVALGLYTALVELLRIQGIRNILAGITLPNEKSVGFHEQFGFSPVGIYKHVGFKFDQWHDVGWWEMRIGKDDESPEPLKALSDIIGHSEWVSSIQKGERIID